MLDLAGAVEADWPDAGVAAHYGDPMREQRAMAAGPVLVDRSNRDRKSTRLNSSHITRSRMPSSA